MTSKSIVTLIKADHQPLKAGIRVLKSESSTPGKKKKALTHFLRDLKLHSKSEELSLYDIKIDEEPLRNLVLEGYEEHGLADMLAAQLEKSNFDRNWSDEIAAKAKVLAELVEHHVKEEEAEMLPELKSSCDASELKELGRIYTETYQGLRADLLGENKRKFQQLQLSAAGKVARIKGGSKVQPMRKLREQRIVSHTHV